MAQVRAGTIRRTRTDTHSYNWRPHVREALSADSRPVHSSCTRKREHVHVHYRSMPGQRRVQSYVCNMIVTDVGKFKAV